MGARNHQTVISGRVGDVILFWNSFSELECSLPGPDIVKDLFHLCAVDNYFHIMQITGYSVIDQEDSFSRLHKAVLGLTTEKPEEVIRKSRACINDTDSLGRSALHWAASQGDLDKTDQLLRCGAEPDAQDYNGKMPIHLAVGLGNDGVVSALIKAGANLESRDSMLHTPLHIAAMNNHISTISLLVNAGANLEALNGLDETPLLSACLVDASNAVELLSSLGADPERKCYWGCTSLGKAIKFNRYKTAKFLLERGVQRPTIRCNHKSPLHIIAMNTDKVMMELCLKAGLGGFDVDAVDQNGRTALQLLELRENARELIDVFAQLCGHGAVEEDEYFDALEHI